MTKLNTRELLSEQLTLSLMLIIAHQEKWVIAFERLMIQGKSCAPSGREALRIAVYSCGVTAG
jgi:hypothetical protein